MSIPQCEVQMCRQREKSAGKSSLARAAVARVLAKAARAVATQTSAFVVDRSVIDDLSAVVETRVAVSVASVET